MKQDNSTVAKNTEVAQWEEFKKNPCWAHIVRVLNEAIDSQQEKVNSINPQGNLKLYDSRDIDIVRMQEMITLADFPNQAIEILKGGQEITKDTMDPYLETGEYFDNSVVDDDDSDPYSE